jgi:hypothetical protein
VTYRAEVSEWALGGEQDDLPWMRSWLVMLQDLPAHDYWLFDSRTLVQLHFGDMIASSAARSSRIRP